MYFLVVNIQLDYLLYVTRSCILQCYEMLMRTVSVFTTEQRKILANSGICAELGWSCIPLVVESFGAWGQLASDTFKKLASRHSVQVNSSPFTTLDSIYSRLNLSLVHSNARAFLARAGPRAKVSDLYLDG